MHKGLLREFPCAMTPYVLFSRVVICPCPLKHATARIIAAFQGATNNTTNGSIRTHVQRVRTH